MRVVFVCLGNLCRSAMATVIFREILSERKYDDIEIDSCGIIAKDGVPAPENVRKAMIERYGKDVLKSHMSKKLNQEIINNADKIIIMGKDVESHIINEYHIDENKMIFMDIPDPYLAPVEVYRECIHNIEKELRARFNEIIGE